MPTAVVSWTTHFIRLQHTNQSELATRARDRCQSPAFTLLLISKTQQEQQQQALLPNKELNFYNIIY